MSYELLAITMLRHGDNREAVGSGVRFTSLRQTAFPGHREGLFVWDVTHTRGKTEHLPGIRAYQASEFVVVKYIDLGVIMQHCIPFGNA
jgi:hypothetical protein